LQEQVTGFGAMCEIGGHTDAAFAKCEIVIPSPGVPPRIGPIETAKKRGATVIGEVELASAYCASRIIAVTGTNGKTTVTELVRHMIGCCGGDAGIAGNNALPLSAAVMQDQQPEYLVVEVSSYALELVDTFHPWIAAVLNVSPDHLARHGSVEAYADVKERVFMNQGAGDFAVVNADDPVVAAMGERCAGQVVLFGLNDRLENGVWAGRQTIHWGDEVIAAVDDWPLPGKHNLANACAAMACLLPTGFDADGVVHGLRTFRGVEHRIEYVDTIDDVAYYNDSKATNIESLSVALDSFDTLVVLIAGGEGKGADYRILREKIRGHVRAMILIGEDAPLLDEAFGDVVATCRADSMGEAVKHARRYAEAGDVVLLSPACASFDMYVNFEERGRDFKECVAKLAKGVLT